MSVHSLVTALCLAFLAAGCDGGGHAPTEPEPKSATLILDFGYIEVIEDCDGIEGDGDFEFRVITADSQFVTHYHERPNLPPGGRTRTIGRRTFTFATASGTIFVYFVASEWDRDIFGNEYRDDRLFEQTSEVRHILQDGVWQNLGSKSATLGSSGCLVRLTWTATAE